MKTKNRTLIVLTALALSVTFSITSCKKDSDSDNGTETPQDGDAFAIVGGVNNPSAIYMLTSENLASGSVTAVGKGVEMSGNGRLFKKGYRYDIVNGALVKYKYENNLLTPAGQLTITGNSLYAYWMDDATLMVWNGIATAPNNVMTYTIVNVDNMTITKTGTIALTGLVATDKAIYMSGCILRNNRLYIPYAVYHSGWTATSVSYLASVDYPSMENLVITSDTRSAYAGSFSSVIPATALFNGDIYMITNTGDRWGSTPDKPSAVYRIKAGENAFDAAYFFDLSAISDGNREYYGLWDLGNGKALTRVGRKDLLTTFDDYFTSDVFDYYILDLTAKTRTKLDLPLSKVVHASPVLVENGKAYIAVASSSKGNYVWTYDITSGSLTQGLEIKGLDNVDWISRFK